MSAALLAEVRLHRDHDDAGPTVDDQHHPGVLLGSTLIVGRGMPVRDRKESVRRPLDHDHSCPDGQQ